MAVKGAPGGARNEMQHVSGSFDAGSKAPSGSSTQRAGQRPGERVLGPWSCRRRTYKIEVPGTSGVEDHDADRVRNLRGRHDHRFPPFG